jgi:hypothetical protein
LNFGTHLSNYESKIDDLLGQILGLDCYGLQSIHNFVKVSRYVRDTFNLGNYLFELALQNQVEGDEQACWQVDG